MPAHSLDALSKSLKKGEIAPVYYLYGSEDVLKDEAVRGIIDGATDQATRDFNLDQRSAAQLDPEEIHALCNTLPMMAERRVVVLRDIEAWKRKTKARNGFLRYLEHPSPQTVVILVQSSGEDAEDKELVRGACAVRFDPLSSERAAKWVLREAGKLGVTIEPDAAEHLVRSVGADLGGLVSELAKLASLPANGPVTAATVGELVGIQHGETIWDWRAAILDDQSGRAVSLLSAILAQPGMSGVKMVTHLGAALIGLGVARGLYDRGGRGRSLEDSIFRTLLKNRPGNLLSYKAEAAHWSRLCPQWPSMRIRSALRAALEADQALKSTTISDERGVLTDLVLRIGVRAAEAA
ncbi:MAG TPA: DNA polymerase III subunit delta [Gemmatimonadales bacterium]|nr:DNA polymerase III subunit delta [Gemmatimonadales bacterium]